jgi:hypothetical protein
MKTNIHFRSYLAHLFLEQKMFQTTVVEKLETQLCKLLPVNISVGVMILLHVGRMMNRSSIRDGGWGGVGEQFTSS